MTQHYTLVYGEDRNADFTHGFFFLIGNETGFMLDKHDSYQDQFVTSKDERIQMMCHPGGSHA